MIIMIIVIMNINININITIIIIIIIILLIKHKYGGPSLAPRELSRRDGGGEAGRLVCNVDRTVLVGIA